ncbi:hypothetical protein GUJ93_ZPchr0004g40431 [Zizania palustris]|uniref:DUF4220 domain-containing protein n=1 Tax=Zizania palustris TaxID=103762 RepID=A0A8J5UUH6_ZIZPA|nr:hypothetical protein GUJ93_ZPchr0023g33379 [Zizania palustris]KAG8064115.1 hypothetical protein GUJ93_ZPchr0004g40431 [Zizania palustris]
MAGDLWVMDIIWHSMVLGLNALVDVWKNWSMEILLGASFVLQLVLALTAGFRWRGTGATSGAVRKVVWFCYVGASYVATTALGKFSVSGTSGTRQLVAFWSPFFLLHLGGPDSITAFELEDNQLSARYVMEFILRVVGVVYIIYKSISGSWDLILAAWLMFLVGVANASTWRGRGRSAAPTWPTSGDPKIKSGGAAEEEPWKVTETAAPALHHPSR